MNRITATFLKKKSLLNIFITAGYPALDSLPTLASQLFEHGVDILEVGMPYSDPLADGPVIQETSSLALQNGITLQRIFEQIKLIRQTEKDAPIFLMGYLNQLLQFGPEAFCKACAEAEVDGLIIPDLPYEIYQEKYQSLLKTYGLAISFLVTPRTNDLRIKALDQACNSFLYIVSDNSITGGSKDQFSSSQLAYFKRINSMKLKNPTMIGFGISSKKMLKQAGNYANGAIIGTAYLESVKRGEQSNFIKELTQQNL